MRKKYVAGNWKMNLTLAEARALIEGIRAKMPQNPPVDIGVFPPFPLLFPMAKALEGSPIIFGAQNCYFEPKGAFTGEVSPQQIKDTGARAVIIGHSERRHIFKEDNALLKKKVVAALAAGLDVIYCVGELLEERDAGRMEAVLDAQLTEVLGGEISLDRIVIAYEPVWAIGTGRTATPQQAQEAHAFIRQRIAKLYNSQSAETLRIQYGGSVKADNARELMSQPDVDGVLVGGASLKADDFVGIINGAIAAK
ncbi:MAG TPA: triose-phosphate isomerase [Phycisphaerae bacterium]|jgi:triosephosphate isomerase|nr:triose-phosphate isomerase [Phycisphaerae bacterium]HOB76084.1 triose-phosphate isomerase [Phycisphaerae bacterium]HOJ55454.1 triose-phosphate isomerase [Phycisphaerae bacterium]HOL25683.1 triose-phosphate isomerase [Phycisphaerae bacterium]HPP19624.1 triose-phosphate isomerase [Phycisphaerae bacterium]